MKRTCRIILVRIAIILASVGVLTTGCSKGKDASLQAMRTDAEILNSRLDESQRALQASNAENDRLQTSHRDLLEQLASLERETQKELERLQSLRDEEAVASKQRISGLSAQIYALRQEIEAKDALNAQMNTQLAERAQTIGQMSSSIEAHRRQVADLEKERAALAEELRSTKKSRARALLVMGVALAGSIIAGFVTLPGLVRRRSTTNSAVRVEPVAASRK